MRRFRRFWDVVFDVSDVVFDVSASFWALTTFLSVVFDVSDVFDVIDVSDVVLDSNDVSGVVLASFRTIRTSFFGQFRRRFGLAGLKSDDFDVVFDVSDANDVSDVNDVSASF